MFRFIVSTLCCFISFYAGAQTLYQFKYEFKDGKNVDKCDAFLVRYDDGTGFIRVNLKDVASGESYLVDMDIQENYETDSKTGKVDSSVLYFDGIDPVVIDGDTSAGYDPETYVFQWNEQTGYYEPLTVYSIADDNSYIEGNFTDVKLLTQEDLTPDFVAQYFFEDEEFYKDLFKTSTRQLTENEKAITLRLIVVANTNDPDIGSTCVLDKDRTLGLFKDLAEFMGIKFQPVTIFGDTYNKQNVADAIDNLKPAPQDIVVFYYSGHGFSKSDNRQYPYIELRAKQFQGIEENSMNIEDIYNSIKAKGAHVNLVISDCCNTAVGTPNAVSGEVALTRSSSLPWNMNNCLQLFIPQAPISVLMTAAQKGEMSAGNNSYGGFFTFNFRSSLLSYLSPMQTLQSVSWKTLVNQAQTQTSKKAYNTLCKNPDGTSSRCNQHPVFKMW